VNLKTSRIPGKTVDAAIVAGEFSVEGEFADDGGVRAQFAPVFVGQTASVLQGVAGCCRVLQGVAECCRVLKSVAECYSVLHVLLQCVAVLQCVVACCSVSPCVAVCYRVLQCVARHIFRARARQR